MRGKCAPCDLSTYAILAIFTSPLYIPWQLDKECTSRGGKRDMKFPTVGAAVRDWRGWIDGQRSDEPDSQMLIRIIYSLWIVAFLLKHAGSAWDIAWHFRYVFGAFEPPHLVNVVGTALATTLVVFHTITGRAAD